MAGLGVKYGRIPPSGMWANRVRGLVDLRRAEKIVAGFKNLRVAVVGDLMLDRYVWGKASRISQEAPVPIVRVERETSAPGGAANVLRNLATLGGTATPFGVIGDDGVGQNLCAVLERYSTDLEGLLRKKDLRTTEKTRVLAGNQQVVRVDTEDGDSLTTQDRAVLLDRLERACKGGGFDAIIVEDYDKGIVNKALLTSITAIAAECGVPVALDPHPGNPLNVKGLKLMTPNRSEAFALAGAYLVRGAENVMGDEALLQVVAKLEELWAPEHLLVTLGPRGMALFREGAPALHVPTKAREVFDVSGAGDTVIATCTLALCAGASPEEAAIMANHGAGAVVGKVGTAPIYPEELIESFENDVS